MNSPVASFVCAAGSRSGDAGAMMNGNRQVFFPGGSALCFGENVWKAKAATYGDMLKRGGQSLPSAAPRTELSQQFQLECAPTGERSRSCGKDRDSGPAEAIVPRDLGGEQRNVGKRMFKEVQVNFPEELAQVMRRAITHPNYIADIDASDQEYMISETAR